MSRAERESNQRGGGGRGWSALGVVGAVVAFVTWLTWPLWHTYGSLFMRGLQHHKVTPLWRHDFTARVLAEGRLVSALSDFDFPSPVSRFDSNDPSEIEFIVNAPTAFFLDWPEQWGLAQALDILLVALSVVWLARALGCRRLGAAIAGAMAAVSWPLWFDSAAVRVNAVWVWTAFATIAALAEICLASLPLREAPSPRRWLWWGGLILIAAAMGAQSLIVYPFHAVLAAPLGAVVLWPHLRRGRGLALVGVCLGLGLGLAVAWGDLMALLAWAPKSRVASCLPNYRCPWPEQVIPGELLLRLIPGGSWALMEYYGTSLFGWALAPLALVARRGRVGSALIFAGVVAYGLLSVGPCPTWLPGQLPEGTILDNVSEALVPFYCAIMPLKNWSRLLLVALGFAAALTGLGVEALWRRGQLGRAMGAALGLVAVAHPTWLMRAELEHRSNWTEIREPQSVAWLKSVEPGPLAELPFDPVEQYLSVIGAPVAPRLNPVTLDYLDDWPMSEQPFLRWLQLLGRARLPPEPYPSVQSAQASGLRYVYFDPTRCERSPSGAQSTVCTDKIPAALKAVLGAASPLEQGAMYWDLHNLAPSP